MPELTNGSKLSLKALVIHQKLWQKSQMIYPAFNLSQPNHCDQPLFYIPNIPGT